VKSDSRQGGNGYGETRRLSPTEAWDERCGVPPLLERCPRPLVQSVTEFSRYVRKYVQGHSVSERVPGFPPPVFTPFDGIAELWFDSVADIGKAFSEPRYLETIRPDELKFLDLPNCTIFVVEEVAIYG